MPASRPAALLALAQALAQALAPALGCTAREDAAFADTGASPESR